MKKSISLWGIISLLIICCCFVACDDDDDYDDIYRSFALVQLADGANTFSLLTERGNTLIPENPGAFINDLTNGEWVIATFYIEDDDVPSQYTIELLALQKVLTKPYWILTTENADTVVVAEKDPGAIFDAWVVEGPDLAYINVRFQTWWMSGLTYVNLIQNNTITVNGETQASTTENPLAGVWTLEFITNYTGTQYFPPQRSNSIVSFTMPLETLDGLTSININYTNFNSVQSVYTINLNGSSNVYDGNSVLKFNKIKVDPMQIE